jgi:hypothetical protein
MTNQFFTHPKTLQSLHEVRLAPTSTPTRHFCTSKVMDGREAVARFDWWPTWAAGSGGTI